MSALIAGIMDAIAARFTVREPVTHDDMVAIRAALIAELPAGWSVEVLRRHDSGDLTLRAQAWSGAQCQVFTRQIRVLALDPK